MAVTKCGKNGGYKSSSSTKCYTGANAKAQAVKQDKKKPKS
jgi:hypothetical protein